LVEKTLELVLLLVEVVELNLLILLMGVEDLDLLIKVMGIIYPLDNKLANPNLNPETQ
jgi:hypothetical protein